MTNFKITQTNRKNGGETIKYIQATDLSDLVGRLMPNADFDEETEKYEYEIELEGSYSIDKAESILNDYADDYRHTIELTD